jgi:CO dehydrogenase maturation factor
MNRHDYVRFRFRQALVEAKGFDLVAMGHPEGSGCYCFANDLLSECMIQLERDYRFIVIDTEAGMEHISRGTIGKPDMLLIVSDPGQEGYVQLPVLRRSQRSLDSNRDEFRLFSTVSNQVLHRLTLAMIYQ